MVTEFVALKENAAVSLDGVASMLITAGLVMAVSILLQRLVVAHVGAAIVVTEFVALKENAVASLDGVASLLIIALNQFRYNRLIGWLFT